MFFGQEYLLRNVGGRVAMPLLTAALIVSSPSWALAQPQASCTTPLDCYEKALAQLKASQDLISNLQDRILKTENELAGIKAAKNAARKICATYHVANGDKWRDSIIVPDNWTLNDCIRFRNSVDGELVQIGCLNPEGVSWASTPFTKPPDNACGW